MGKRIFADINAINESTERLIENVNRNQASGVDGFYIYNFLVDREARDKFLLKARSVKEKLDIRMFIGIYAEDFEDIKRAYYVGADTVYVSISSDETAVKKAVERFGADKVGMELDYSKEECSDEILRRVRNLGVKSLMLKHIDVSEHFFDRLKKYDFHVFVRDSLKRHGFVELLQNETVNGIATNYYTDGNISKVKQSLISEGVDMEIRKSLIPFSELKKGDGELVPVITYDYKTGEILMLAYMNEEAFNKTIETGKMTYWSRSRNALWVKGDTSGHCQYVKKLTIDCDKDTIAASVRQVGAACHTGERSCFYMDIFKEDERENGEELYVLKRLYDKIKSRKENPKKGSYTNYLFDKGIDKILKKLGEENTEIVIAAKNPDRTELKYEIADYLYHLTVLMADSGLTFEEVCGELSERETEE